MLGTHYLPQLYVTICHVISCDCKSVMVGHMRIQFYQLQLVMRGVVEQNLHLSSIYIYIYIFFFFSYCGRLVVVVVVVVVWVVVVVADGRGGCGWCCGWFFGNEIYYFIVVDILFYCNVYIILLCWKLK